MGKATKPGVESNVGGVTGKGFKPGQSGNAGGLTKRQRQVRDQLLTWLCSDGVTRVGKQAYLAALKAREPAIVKDFADRVMGKVKAHVELSNDPDRPFEGWSADALIKALRGDD